MLLICAIVAGLAGGFAARFRSWGTSITDLATGAITALMFSGIVLVVAVLWADLNMFGAIHYIYLLVVIGFPIGVAIISLPHLLNAEFKTPLVVWPLVMASIGLIAAGLWGTHVAPNQLVVDEGILGAEGATQPIVIGVIADLQTPTIGDHERSALEQVVAGEPDVVVLPGDLYQIPDDDLDTQLPEFLGWLRELRRQVDTVVLVSGEVDDPVILEELAEEAGIHYLDDSLLTIDVNGQDVTFAGMSVESESPRGTIDPTLTEELAASTTSNDLVIAVSHAPDTVLSLPANTTVDLTISGHTHGGHFSLPWIGPIITLTDVPKTVAAGGLHVVNDHPIYVSTGVGLERGQAAQLRFGVPPSVALLTVLPADS